MTLAAVLAAENRLIALAAASKPVADSKWRK